MRLLRVELSRFFSRRAVALLLVVAALLTLLVAGTTIWDTRPVSAREQASAQAQVREQLRDPGFTEQLADCRSDPEELFGPDATAADCDQLTPSAEDYLSRRPLSLDEQRDQGGIAVIVILTALMIIIGTTYAGADWATGSMSNQLLFEPRRLRVWAAKAAAATVGSATAAGVLMVAFWAVLFAVARSRGIGTDADVLQHIGWLVVRGVVLATAAGLGGYALTMLLRSTVATVALLFAYAAGGEALLALAPIRHSALWSPTTSVFAWVQDGVRAFDDDVVCGPGRQLCTDQYTVSLAHGAEYLGILLAIAMLLSAVLFRRRDIP
jgi:ABC-2 type transport system permease protein